MTGRVPKETRRFLAEVGQVLATSLDYEHTLQQVARLAVPRFADWCAVDVVSDSGEIQRLAIAHVDPAKERIAADMAARYPPVPGAAAGASLVLREGKALLLSEVPAAFLRQIAQSEDHLRLLRQLGLGSAIIVPMVARGRTVGAITLVAMQSRGTYSTEDLTFVEDLASRAAVYVDNARLYKQAELARARAEAAERRAAFLAEVGGVLASSLDYDVTLDNVARLAVSSIADVCLVDVVENETGLRRVATAHRDPSRESLLARARPYPPDVGRSPLARPLRTGEPVHLPALTDSDLEEIAPTPDYKRLLRELGVRSLLCLPLIAHGNRLGVLTLAMAESGRNFDPAEVPSATELARRAALAVENARLYRASQQAVRAREGVLSIVSHDLRNPLGTIHMSARILLDSVSIPEDQRAKHLGVIIRATERMGRLIQDLLDFARLDAGQELGLDRQVHEIVGIVAEMSEAYRPQADAKLVRLSCDVAGDLPSACLDRLRILQVLGNLIGNAIKFTPEGGEVIVRVEPAGSDIRFVVSDTGAGIDPKDAGRVFDRYWQATRTARLGTGLGLPIAKAIVEAHDGRIWFESTPGVGSAFYFTLPADGSPERDPRATEVPAEHSRTSRGLPSAGSLARNPSHPPGPTGR
ncbi:MAG TPA: GAF domain-containing sensor histidine kinase [Thermoanaerobaculia bacterium]